MGPPGKPHRERGIPRGIPRGTAGRRAPAKRAMLSVETRRPWRRPHQLKVGWRFHVLHVLTDTGRGIQADFRGF